MAGGNRSETNHIPTEFSLSRCGLRHKVSLLRQGNNLLFNFCFIQSFYGLQFVKNLINAQDTYIRGHLAYIAKSELDRLYIKLP